MPRSDNTGRFDIGRRKLVQSLGLAGVAGLAGCSGTSDDQSTTTTDEGTTTDEATTQDSSGGQTGSELIATFGADVKNFDPTKATDTTSQKAFGLVYESLLQVDFDGEIQPVLAKSVEQTDADLTWRVNLREGVTFHNGKELTAQDVKSSYERYKGSPNESEVYKWYKSSEVVDDYTLDLTLSDDYAPLKYTLAALPIVPAEAASDELSLAENPVGTGPYTFVEHQPDSLFRIERNGDYWFSGSDSVPAQPSIERITFRVIIEQSAQLAALQGGDVDMINAPPAGSVSDLKSNDKFTVTERQAGGFDLLSFPTKLAPFDNAKVRRGISRLVPRDAIVKSVYNGIGIPAYTPVSPLAADFTSEEFNQQMGEEYLGYNQEKANTLLEEGFANSDVQTPFKTTIISNENPQRVRWAQLIAESLNSTDYFDVSVEQFEWNTYVGKILSEKSASKNELIAVGWSGGWDPDAYVYNLVHSGGFTPNGFNMAHYANDEVDSLLAEGLSTYDTQERAEIYKDLMEILCRDAPMTYIRFGMEMDAFHTDRVKGFQTYPINGSEFQGIYAPASDANTELTK
ncbi:MULTISPECIES: ABC transporter substrate-binding protein [Halorussus]|uniref:ABC transporter substrate-binding protein n=1 Tax=Halorussus TaxID=1070314 RepID=UPI000E20E3DF|nr:MULTISPECIES: ABC transporter substrate-binding protein [Halorussus]NHN57638.1 ABC transporter substrate-binding protein [Halorussus sp. JP-T4]